MLMMAIPEVKILAVRLLAIWFDLFASWQQRLWFKALQGMGRLTGHGRIDVGG